MIRLVCSKCAAVYSANEPRWRCDCGHVLDIRFKPGFPLEKIKQRKPGMWRYREAIPLDEDVDIVSFAEGFTPLITEPACPLPGNLFFFVFFVSFVVYKIWRRI